MAHSLSKLSPNCNKMKTQIAFVSFVVSAIFIMNAVQGQRQVYCGRRLADTLAYICNNPLINGAASNSVLMKRSDRYYNSIASDVIDWPWISHHQAKSIRNKRQVVSECCYKPCSLNELLAYC